MKGTQSNTANNEFVTMCCFSLIIDSLHVSLHHFMEVASFHKNTGSSSLSGISKNSNKHILLHSKKVIGFESCAILPVVEALLFAPIVNVCLEV